MNAMRAFVMSTCGEVTDQQMSIYHQQVYNNYTQVKAAGGWMAEGADKAYSEFSRFVESREWEMSGRMNATSGNERLGAYAIGRLVTMQGIQAAEGMMRDYIMSMPGVMEAYQAEELSGWEGAFSDWCNGVGEDNIYYRRQMNGLLNFREHEGNQQAYYKHYIDSVASTQLSVRERLDLAVTRHAVNHHLANSLFDLTSADNRKRPTDEEETPKSE